MTDLAEIAPSFVEMAHRDDATRTEVWNLFKHAPAPVGFDPVIIPQWKEGPTSAAFAAIEVVPYRLRLMPGSVMLGGGSRVLSWQE